METYNDLTPDKIQEIAKKFQESRVLLTAVELGIFTVLNKKRLTSLEISEIIQTDPRGMDRLLNALTALGFLLKRNDKFMNFPGISEFLVKGESGYMGNLHHTNSLWDRWSSLTEAVKNGGSVNKKSINSRGKEWLEDFIAAMHYRGTGQAKILSMMIDLSNVKKMLDVGGGSGAYSMRFMEKNKDIDAVLFDLPNVIPIAKKYVENNGKSEKFTFVTGDYLVDDFGTGYDLIFLSAIVHINSFEENRLLIKKCVEALNPKGQIVINDFIMNENRVEPKIGVMFALNMLTSTLKGDTYTESEIAGWFKESGLHSIEHKQTSFGSSIMIAIKD
ncbi:MAG: methyltransferase [bacterium]